MHELGHNMYLNHAGSYQANNATKRLSFVGYKDDSAAMGFCCSTRCHNAPHSFQLGWSRPIDTLHKDNFAAGAPPQSARMLSSCALGTRVRAHCQVTRQLTCACARASAGEWRSYTLPPRSGGHSSDKNMLRLVADWSSQSASYNLFLEYRCARACIANMRALLRALHALPLACHGC